MKSADRFKFVIGLVVLFAGLDLAILLSHMSRLIGIIFIILGIGIIFWSLEEKEPKLVRKPKKKKPENIAQRIIDILTLDGRLKPYLPVIGIAIIVLIAYFNIVYSDKSN